MASSGKMKKQIRFISLFFCLHFFLVIGCKSSKASLSINEDTIEATADASEVEGNTNAIDKNEEIKSHESSYDIRHSSVRHDIERFLKSSEVFSSHFTGFSLYDLADDQFIVNYNGDKYFTPASNVKVLTLYAVLKSFEKKMPTALYAETEDTLFVRPIGDPTFLHPEFQEQNLLFIMRNTPKPVAILWPKQDMPSFGIGWMWDDYNTSYQPELCWMPMYGNVASFSYTRSKILR